MITPSPKCRPNPDRAVYVQGVIDQQLIDRLTPEIIKLKSKSFDPITVFIDSPGGSVTLMETLLRLLTASDQDLADPTRLITVVTSMAGSAAADLLSSGDFALAYPGASVLYHGSRVSQEGPLTTELTSLLTQYLREANQTYATRLARKIVDRFMFRFVSSQAEFDDVRKRDPTQTSDLDCFLTLISENLSAPAKRVLEGAKARYSRYDDLLNWVVKRSKVDSVKTKAQFEAIQIKAIVDFEVRNNKKNKDWSFEGGGLNSLTYDFFLLNEYLGNYHSGYFRSLCLRYGHFLLSDDEIAELENAPEGEESQSKVNKAQPLLLPVWSFFVSLCHALQQGENDLSARDAVWLGLIDEVIGVDELPSRRLAYEYEPDDAPAEVITEERADAATETERFEGGKNDTKRPKTI